MAAWKDLLAVHLVSQYSDVLPTPFQEESFAFYGGILSGATTQRPRDVRAIGAVNSALGDAVGRLYAKRYFPASGKADIEGMATKSPATVVMSAAATPGAIVWRSALPASAT